MFCRPPSVYLGLLTVALGLLLAGADRSAYAQEVSFVDLPDTCLFDSDCALDDKFVPEGEFPADIYLNGRFAAEQKLVRIEESGTLLLSKEALVESGIWDRYRDRDKLEDTDFYDIESIAGITAEFNKLSLTVDVEIALESREEQLFLQGDKYDLSEVSTPTNGAHFKYRADVFGDSESDFLVNYKLEPTAQLGLTFVKAGLSGRFGLTTDIEDGHNLDYLHADRVVKSKQLRVRAGIFRPDNRCWLWKCNRDTILGASIQSLGLDYARVSLRNGLVHTGFTSTPDTTVELLVNGTVIEKFVSDGGQWRLETSLLGQGIQDVTIRQIFPDGRVEEEEKRFFNSSINLLKKGKSQTSLSGGYRTLSKPAFPGLKVDIDEVFVAGALDIGLSDTATLHAFGHGERIGQSLGIGLTKAYGKKGLLDLAAAASHTNGRAGYKLDGIYSWYLKNSRISAFASFQDDYFSPAEARLLSQEFGVGLSVNHLFKNNLSMSASADYYEREIGGNTFSVSGGLSVPSDAGRWRVDGSYSTSEGVEDYRLLISLSGRLGKERYHNFTSTAELKKDSIRTENSYFSYKPERLSTDYGITHTYEDLEDTDSQALRAHARVRNSAFDVFADGKIAEGRTSGQIGVEGGVSLYGNNVNFIRNIERGGIIIDTGYANNKIYANRANIGQTNTRGIYFDDGAKLFAGTTYNLDSIGLPDGYSYETQTTSFRPSPGAIYYFNPKARERVTAVITLKGENDRPVPAGRMLLTKDGNIIGLVGDEGFAFIDDLPEGESGFRAMGASDEICSFDLPEFKSTEKNLQLGEVICK